MSNVVGKHVFNMSKKKKKRKKEEEEDGTHIQFAGLKEYLPLGLWYPNPHGFLVDPQSLAS